MSINDFADMLIDTVIHKAKTGSDGYGAPTYAAGTAYSARVVYRQRLFRSISGQDVTADGSVIIMGTPTVEADDQLELPDGSAPVIIATEKHSDDSGLHHTRVFFSVSRGPK